MKKLLAALLAMMMLFSCIAAMADQHYVIRKAEHDGRTFTNVTELDREGRRQELARLHGGDNITETTLLSAEEQLKACERFKAELPASASRRNTLDFTAKIQYNPHC